VNLARKTHLDTEIPTYRERLGELSEQLRIEGHLGLLLVDVRQLAQVEHDYGSKAFEQVLAMVTRLVSDLQGKEVRSGDILALNDRDGNAFLVFLKPHREEKEGRLTRLADLEAIAHRVADHLNRELAGLSSPYLRGRHTVTVGYAIVFHNPLIMEERVIARLVGEAWESVHIQKMQADFQTRCRLQDVLLAQQIHTVFQPILDLQNGGILGLEALSRGPAASPHHSPLRLFEAAAATDLVFELDRHCRRRAMRTARDLPPPYHLFINVVPASMYDPDFQGTSLIELLVGLGLSPKRIVLEVSEQYAIENYTLFVEALQNFTQLGFSIAVDDIGAAHSGLEKVAHLNPRYLKFDIQLVRDIDQSHVKREMARAPGPGGPRDRLRTGLPAGTPGPSRDLRSLRAGGHRRPRVTSLLPRGAIQEPGPDPFLRSRTSRAASRRAAIAVSSPRSTGW
jgi:EAL domain-containing protein (putative c-di-GMP-specific phosphodiesterase class I)/GGDEF domain-containing protein